jgi:hypothetical protein
MAGAAIFGHGARRVSRPWSACLTRFVPRRKGRFCRTRTPQLRRRTPQRQTPPKGRSKAAVDWQSMRAVAMRHRVSAISRLVGSGFHCPLARRERRFGELATTGEASKRPGSRDRGIRICTRRRCHRYFATCPR